MLDVTINDVPVDGVTIQPPWVDPNRGSVIEFATTEPPPFDYDRMFTIGLFGRTFHAHLQSRTTDAHARRFSLRGDGQVPVHARRMGGDHGRVSAWRQAIGRRADPCVVDRDECARASARVPAAVRPERVRRDPARRLR